MYAQMDILRSGLDPASAEHIADIFQRIGSDLLSNNDYNLAQKWLRRAYEFIDAQGLEDLYVEGVQLHLSISHDLIQSLLGMGSDTDVQEARNLVAYLESKLGDEPIVLHWKLEILQKSAPETFDTEEYASILRHMIPSINICEDTITFMLYQFNLMWEKNAVMASRLLDDLLIHRLAPLGESEWMARAVVQRVRFSTMQLETSQEVTDLTDLLQRIQEGLSTPLDPDVTGACLSVCFTHISSPSKD